MPHDGGTSIAFASVQRGWVATQGPHVFMTTNGGESWTQLTFDSVEIMAVTAWGSEAD